MARSGAERCSGLRGSERAERLFTLLRDVNKAFHDLARTAWHEHALARPAAIVMREVDHHPGTTVSGLSRITGLAKSNVSKAVEALVEKGFVEKRSDPKDQRLIRLYATDEAKAHFHRMLDEVRRRVSAVISGLSDEELDSTIASLEALKKAVQDGSPE
ncbi:MAG TPA: MarR family transcriptional regulator [Firmicutes bacterium]|nr:MarR family transcriptional regulator [Candidatus Fermentithermobacillaceae bacterium]